MLLKAMLLVTAGLFATADKDTDKEGRGPKGLQGKWIVVSGEENGKRQTQAQLKGSTVEFSDRRIRLRSPREDLTMTFTAYPDKKPAAIDFVVTKGPDKGKISKGIYRLDGNRLRIAYAQPGQDRPKDFSAAKGTRQMSWSLRRADSNGK